MTMSEALASMNGNLASQQDEIEELKMQLRVSKDFRFQLHNFYYWNQLLGSNCDIKTKNWTVWTNLYGDREKTAQGLPITQLYTATVSSI